MEVRTGRSNSSFLIFCSVEFSERCEAVAKSHLFQHQLLDRQLLHQLSSISQLMQRVSSKCGLHMFLQFTVWICSIHLPLPSYGESFLSLLVFVWRGQSSKYAIDKFDKQFCLLVVSQANSLRKQTTGQIPSNFLHPRQFKQNFLQVPWFIIMAPQCG